MQLHVGTVAVMMLALAALPVAPVHGQASRQQQSAQPAPPAPVKGPAGPAAEGTPAKVIDNTELDGLLGKEVRSSAGENMGRIVDLLVDRAGKVRAVVIDFGGFLGVGSRKIVVDWAALHFAPAGKPAAITLELTRDQVKVAPEYKRGEPVVVLRASDAKARAPKRPPAAPEK